MVHIEITIRDEEWPTVKLQITTPDGKVHAANAHYSIASSQFEPIIREACSKFIDGLITAKRKRRE